MHYYLLQKVGLNLTVAEHTLNFPRTPYESCGEKLWPEIAALAFEPTHFPFLIRCLVLLSKAPCMFCVFILLHDSLHRKKKSNFIQVRSLFFLPLRLTNLRCIKPISNTLDDLRFVFCFVFSSPVIYEGWCVWERVGSWWPNQNYILRRSGDSVLDNVRFLELHKNCQFQKQFFNKQIL